MRKIGSVVALLCGLGMTTGGVAVENNSSSLSPSDQSSSDSRRMRAFIGIKHDISDFATPINGYLYKEYWGNWVSRTTGKRYMIGIAKLPNEENPGAIFLEEVKENRPGQSVYGIERTATIRAAALVNKSNKVLTVNGGYCHPSEGQKTPHFDRIIAVLSPKRAEEAHAEIYSGSGIEAISHQAWFLDVDSEALIPLSLEELRQIKCMDTKW